MFPGSIVIANPRLAILTAIFYSRSWDTDSRRVARWICAIPTDVHIAEWQLVDSVRAAP